MTEARWIIENGEALQYVAFFGMLLLCGIAETVLPARREDPRRRRRWTANFALTFANVMLLGALAGAGLSGLFVAEAAAAAGFGLIHAVALPAFAAIAAGILARSLIAYAIHSAMHKVPLLWRLHRVHHADPALDVSTTARFHPLEFVVALPVQLAAIALLGIPPLAFMLYEILDAAMAVFTHANIRLPAPIERVLRWVVVTPALHRIHHSARSAETDSNYGATFSFWDRLFGTYVGAPAASQQHFTIGLDDVPSREGTGLGWLIAAPFRARVQT